MNSTNSKHRALLPALFLLACSGDEPKKPAPTAPQSISQPAAPQSAAIQASATPSTAPATPAGPDTIETSAGPLKITPITHASLLLEVGGKAIYVDPWSQGDFTGRPKADLILITDIHQDHLDPQAIALLRTDKTAIIAPEAVAAKSPDLKAIVLKNGERRAWEGIDIEAVPMYNLQRGPSPGALYHDKGRGNGYILTIGGKRLYLSGDTECTPEMRALKDIDVAFVCMNLPYTMPPAEAAACVKEFRPKIVYPYHYRDSSLEEFQKGLAGVEGIEVRLRDWYPAK
jgi:L-ascorbate metabolism protein UlaG (beta-lactamase superfamily)